MSGKAKRARERNRMENEREIFERVETWVNDIDNMPEGPYNSCNLMPDLHAADCEGNCKSIGKWELALAHEKARWRRAGADPNSITGDTFALERRVQILSEVLIRADLVTETELNDLFLKMMFRDLVEIRKHFKAATKSHIEVARTMPKNLNGPTH